MSSTKESSFFYVEYLHTCCPRDWVRIKNFENLAYGQVNFTTGYYSKYRRRSLQYNCNYSRYWISQRRCYALPSKIFNCPRQLLKNFIYIWVIFLKVIKNGMILYVVILYAKFVKKFFITIMIFIYIMLEIMVSWNRHIIF